MTDTIKVYTQTVIADLPFPENKSTTSEISGPSSDPTVHSPETIKDTTFPQRTVAVEVFSSALNTRSKKILAEFSFTPMGAIQIGDFEAGVSGDIRISPNGIVARDIAGNTTFALDGDTGDAFFKGTVRAGSLISGDLVLGGKGNADGQLQIADATGVVRILEDKDGITIYDSASRSIIVLDTAGVHVKSTAGVEIALLDSTGLTVNNGKIVVKNDSDQTSIDSKGIVSAQNFVKGESVSTYTGSAVQEITGGPGSGPNPPSYTDITSASFTFSLARSAFVLVMANLVASVSPLTYDGGSGYFGAVSYVGLDVDGSIVEENIATADEDTVNTDSFGMANSIFPQGTHYFASLATGSHTIKLRGRLWDLVGTGELDIYSFRLTYIILGF